MAQALPMAPFPFPVSNPDGWIRNQAVRLVFAMRLRAGPMKLLPSAAAALPVAEACRRVHGGLSLGGRPNRQTASPRQRAERPQAPLTAAGEARE